MKKHEDGPQSLLSLQDQVDSDNTSNIDFANVAEMEFSACEDLEAVAESNSSGLSCTTSQDMAMMNICGIPVLKVSTYMCVQVSALDLIGIDYKTIPERWYNTHLQSLGYKGVLFIRRPNGEVYIHLEAFFLLLITRATVGTCADMLKSSVQNFFHDLFKMFLKSWENSDSADISDDQSNDKNIANYENDTENDIELHIGQLIKEEPEDTEDNHDEQDSLDLDQSSLDPDQADLDVHQAEHDPTKLTQCIESMQCVKSGDDYSIPDSNDNELDFTIIEIKQEMDVDELETLGATEVDDPDTEIKPATTETEYTEQSSDEEKSLSLKESNKRQSSEETDTYYTALLKRIKCDETDQMETNKPDLNLGSSIQQPVKTSLPGHADVKHEIESDEDNYAYMEMHFQNPEEEIPKQEKPDSYEKPVTCNQKYKSEHPHVCPTCGMQYKLLGALTTHLSTYHGIESHQHATSGAKTKHLKLKCNICFQHFGNDRSLRIHLMSHRSTVWRPFQCEKCGARYKYPRWLNSHMETCKGRAEELRKIEEAGHPQLHVWNNQYSSLVQRAVETITHKEVPQHEHGIENTDVKGGVKAKSVSDAPKIKALPYECDKCKLCFKDEATLKSHKMTHFDDETYRQQYPLRCHRCGTRYKLQGALTTHMENCTAVPKDKLRVNLEHICRFCERAYKSLSSLQSHIRDKHREMKIACDQCGKKYKRWTHLNQHKQTCHSSSVDPNQETFGLVERQIKDEKIDDTLEQFQHDLD